MPNDTRDRMIEATVARAAAHGRRRNVIHRCASRQRRRARGAIYHHFPGGKTQIVTEAAARNGRDVRARLAALPACRPPAVVDGLPRPPSGPRWRSIRRGRRLRGRGHHHGRPGRGR